MTMSRRTVLGHIAATAWVSCTTNLQSSRDALIPIAYDPDNETADTGDTIIVGGDDTGDTSLVDTMADSDPDSDTLLDSDSDTLLDSDTDGMACGYADIYVDSYC